MAPRKISKSRIVAKVVTGKKVPCGFCQRDVDDEITYGKLYAIGDIQCHYFCVLLSSCLIQKGKDEDGLFGFIYEDIVNEIERAKKHRCSYCSRGGANLGCSISQCRKQFHLPCGRERNAVSLFYGNYKSFCQLHAPKQNIPPIIMSKARLRRICDGKIKKLQANFKDLKELSNSNTGDSSDAIETDTQSVCVICYEAVDGYPTINTFWPPCCARDAWFHRSCLQRMALSAGMHYLKCPLCNDKENFYEAVVTQGYYVPDRDAAWELEQNAFSEIYEREVECSAADCQCPMGRGHDVESGSWCIKLCLLCGSSGVHSACLPSSTPHVCTVCTPAAPNHIEELASCIQAVISQEQAQTSSRRRRGPIMPSRMSLRRTKRHVNSQNIPSCSSSNQITIKTEMQTPTSNTASSREDLNLKTPKKQLNKIGTKRSERSIDTSHPLKEIDLTNNFENIENSILSPTKMLEESLKNKVGCSNVVVDEELVEELRKRFRRPKPLCEKRKIVNDILNGLFDNLLKEPKLKDPVKQWCSPKKCEIKQEIEVIEILDDSPPSKTVEERIQTSVKQEKDIEPFATPKKSESGLEFKTETTHPIVNTPTKLKTVEILKDSSLEISAKDEIINIDMINFDNPQSDEVLKELEIKSPLESKKCAFKFNPFNKGAENIDMDIETFKDRYLQEMGLQRVKKVTEEEKTTEIPSRKRSRKRKRTADGLVLKYESKKRKRNRNNISIKNKNIQVKIKWRNEQVKLKITDSKKKKKLRKKYKQCILECSPKTCSTIKPKFDVTPMRRKYVKQEKSPDNLVQTSIQSFFKIKIPGNE